MIVAAVLETAFQKSYGTKWAMEDLGSIATNIMDRCPIKLKKNI